MLNGQQVVDASADSKFATGSASRNYRHISNSRRLSCLHNDSAGPHGDPPINLEELAEDITRLALRLGSADNVTVVCVAFE